MSRKLDKANSLQQHLIATDHEIRNIATLTKPTQLVICERGGGEEITFDALQCDRKYSSRRLALIDQLLIKVEDYLKEERKDLKRRSKEG